MGFSPLLVSFSTPFLLFPPAILPRFLDRGKIGAGRKKGEEREMGGRNICQF